MPLKEIHVLLLDDDPTIRMLMTAMLEEVGVGSVITAGEGTEGLRLLDESSHHFNMLICDLTMPGMDGIEFLRHVAARSYGGDVLLFSSSPPSVLKAAKRLATQHGINILDVLEKPVDIDRLADALLRGKPRSASQRRSQPDQPSLSLEELREGIPNGCVRLHYQPKISLHDKQIVGVECLARWRHPVRGLLPPALFIAQVEQGGLIDAFTLEVFRIATAQLRVWCDRGLSLRMNINLSMDNLLRVDLPEILEAICHTAGVSPSHIVLEMTESRLISNVKLGLEILIRLRLKGFGLSIDDFGTGFSTMEALKQLPFSELKIDKTFVNGVEEDASTRAILYSSASLGRTLGINVVAEGVETQTDWNVVADAGCDEVQGYFIARPMAATDFENWLAGQRAMHTKEDTMEKKPRVLVVDDDKTSRLLTRLMLSDDFIVDEAASGEAALSGVANRLPDLIFMDVDMSPGIDGYETCRRLKADQTTAAIPIIFVSGNDALEDRLKGYEAGGEDYVVKPFDGVELEAKLRRLLVLAEERCTLQEQAIVASNTAMTVMTNMSELGSLLETMRHIAACTDTRTLCNAVLVGLAAYGLRGTVQVRTPDGTMTLTEGGEATPLETSVISHMASMERITQFKSRLAITYKAVSLLVHNMPIEDADRCGRLRDHLAMLAEGANARAEAIIATTQAQMCGEVISHASERITATLRSIDQIQRERQCALRIAVETLLSRMQSAFSSITVTMEQEDFITGVVQSGLEQILQIQNENSDPQEQLTSIVLELEQVLVQARSAS